MVDESQVIIPQEAVDINELVNKSEMCIGLNGTMMTLPGNVITGDHDMLKIYKCYSQLYKVTLAFPTYSYIYILIC